MASAGKARKSSHNRRQQLHCDRSKHSGTSAPANLTRNRISRDKCTDLVLATLATLVDTADKLNVVTSFASSASMHLPLDTQLQDHFKILRATFGLCCSAIGMLRTAYPLKLAVCDDVQSSILAKLEFSLVNFGLDRALVQVVPSHRPVPEPRAPNCPKERSWQHRRFMSESNRAVLELCCDICNAAAHLIKSDADKHVQDYKEIFNKLYAIISRHMLEHPVKNIAISTSTVWTALCKFHLSSK